MRLLSAPRILLAVVPWAFVGSSSILAQPAASAQEENHAAHHAAHRALKDEVRHRGIEVLDSPYRTTSHLRHFIARALDEYRFLATALVEDNPGRADHAAAAMLDAVRAVPGEEFRKEGKRVWQQHGDLYERVLREFQHEETIDAKRSYFAHLSEIVYCTVKSFGLGEELSNVFFCPMALGGKGAFWLSESEEVENPYLGAAMPGCGELRETLGP